MNATSHRYDTLILAPTHSSAVPLSRRAEAPQSAPTLSRAAPSHRGFATRRRMTAKQDKSPPLLDPRLFRSAPLGVGADINRPAKDTLLDPPPSPPPHLAADAPRRHARSAPPTSAAPTRALRTTHFRRVARFPVSVSPVT
ncbi:MAG: hypothetical protein GY772_24610 [bacterium]|nr:hypothetical protein [bacterium]